MGDQEKKLKSPAPVDEAKRIEWKKRKQWTIFVLLLFAILALISSALYQTTRGKYDPAKAFQDFGFNVNVNRNVNGE